VPSDFLKEGLPAIYQSANDVFDDLADLSGVVVFFDEMDALFQRRDPKNGGAAMLDVTSQFLTTSMLPKLLKLHDDGRVIFFLATNHQEHFDPAIKRPGRFDLLICLGPPSWKDKLAKLPVWWKGKEKKDLPEAIKQLREYTKDSDLAGRQLDLFTIDEVQALLDHIRGGKGLLEGLRNMEKKKFLSLVDEWCNSYITLHGTEKSNRLLAQYIKDRQSSRVQ
jgi:SpoVK/Ycf46/Vps4 family AAA+-type ATPase